MDIFLQILDYFNIFFIVLTMISTLAQVIFMIASLFCKKTVFKRAEKHNKIAVLIPAHNESKIIKKLIYDLQKQDYPKEKYDIIVIAHNCTDNTKQVATNCGVQVFECQSEKQLKGYALKYAIDEYLKPEYDYDFYVVLDADCRIENNYLTEMNNAYDSGVDIARSYLGGTNTFSNSISQVSTLYDIRDGRLTARVREKLKMNVQLIGNCFFMSRKLLEDFGGFPSSNSLTEDADLMVKCMLKKYKIHYVEDAICYTEHSEKASELFKRNMRLGKGINKIFWRDGYKLIWKFFTTFKITYIDIFFTLSFLPISLISCTWFPAYYIFLILKMIITQAPVLHMTTLLSLQEFIPMAVLVVAIMIIMLSLQGVLAVVLQKDRLLKDTKWTKYIKGILMMCPIMLFTNLAITCGILSPRLKWAQVERIHTYEDNPADNEIDQTTYSSENISENTEVPEDSLPNNTDESEEQFCNNTDYSEEQIGDNLDKTEEQSSDNQDNFKEPFDGNSNITKE